MTECDFIPAKDEDAWVFGQRGFLLIQATGSDTLKDWDVQLIERLIQWV